MLSSIETYAPHGCIFPATFSPLFVLQTCTCIPLYFYLPMKIEACTCSQIASRSTLHSLPLFVLEIAVNLHLQFS